MYASVWCVGNMNLLIKDHSILKLIFSFKIEKIKKICGKYIKYNKKLIFLKLISNDDLGIMSINL